MKFFSKKRLSKGWFTGLVLGVVSSAALVYATVVPVPNKFVPQTGQPISATQMDANFTAIAECPGDMSPVGTFCIDTHEASVWNVATGGTVGVDELTSAACNANGNDCLNIFAQSRAGVFPAVNFTWFQAQQACANVGKRLPTNEEWQMAAAGTVAANCNLTSGLLNTDANPTCLSNYNVINMVGNVSQWVANYWETFAATPGTVNVGTENGVKRGGDAADAANVFFALKGPLNTGEVLGGFRCAR